MSFLKHRDIASVDNSGTQSHLRWVGDKLDLGIVLALYLPYAFLSAAITLYFISLFLFLASSWVGLPDVDGSGSDNRNIFIFFSFSLGLGLYGLVNVQRSRLSLSDQTHDQSYPPADDTVKVPLDFSQELVTAITEAVKEIKAAAAENKEAAVGNKATAAAIQAVAVQLERLSTAGSLLQNSSTADTTTTIAEGADTINPV